jgi:flagellar biosynthesis protein FliR
MFEYAINHYDVFLLIVLRTVAFFALSPVLSMRIWPTWAKLGLAVFVAMLVTPGIHATVPDPFTDPGNYIVAALRETMVGMILGFAATLMISAISVAGQLFDLQIGFSSATLFDPQAGQATGLTSSFMSMLFTLYFLGLNGLDGLLLAVMNSYHYIGINHFVLPHNAVDVLTHLLGLVMVLGIQLAAPLLAALLLMDITFALVSRAVPQMNVFVVGLPAKLYVGMSLFAMIMPAMVYAFGTIFHDVFMQVNMLLQWLGG